MLLQPVLEIVTQVHLYMGTSMVDRYKDTLNSCLGSKIV